MMTNTQRKRSDIITYLYLLPTYYLQLPTYTNHHYIYLTPYADCCVVGVRTQRGNFAAISISLTLLCAKYWGNIGLEYDSRTCDDRIYPNDHKMCNEWVSTSLYTVGVASFK